jgi:type IV pilus assembly protein PilY1
MSIFRNSKVLAALFCLGLLLTSLRAMAEDIDIFTSPPGGGTATAPNVMIVLDNSSEDMFGAKLDAISAVLDKIGPMNVGLAMYRLDGTPSNGKGGAYVRFAVKSMATNKATLQSLLATIKTNKEYAQNIKDEPEAYYEMYKYYSGMTPYQGKKAANPKADPDAFKSDGTYNPPTVPTCGNDYVIYIAANNNFQIENLYGKQTYESPPAGPGSAGPALPGTAANAAKVWADEWTHFLHANQNPQVISYVIDAASPSSGYDGEYRKLLQDEAKQGGGTWQAASDAATMTTALLKIFGEIQAVNSTFASVSLPVNTTNRAQDKNQVFIPQFRPDPKAKPRWMGNLKQYQLIAQGGSIELGDNSLPTPQAAVNPNTGFLTDCAVSFWTTPSINYSGTDAYWKNVNSNTSTAGGCLLAGVDKYSDSPDGPFVEKGGVAEVIRKGNAGTQDWKEHRTIYTQPAAGGALAAFSSTSPGFASATGLSGTALTDLANFVRGQDVNLDEMNGRTDAALTRPSLHGDAIHSRPLPIDYGATKGVTVYYGSNDGMLRSVDAATGQERWAFVAPEFYSKLRRMKDNSPLVKYPAISDTTATPKDYFFDGSLGVYQDATNSKVWIYPSMRRGGRMIYALDVTDPTVAPVYKWKVGCPNLTDDTGCSTGFAGMGQTWSLPSVATSVLGYKDALGKGKPVVIVGGGYDKCEDADVPTCSSPKGAGVYVIDAFTGELVKAFTALRSVAADVSLLALATPDVVDHAYATDTGGNIYRIDFDADQTKWAMNRIAGTAAGTTTVPGKKFLYPAALLPAPGNQVYLAVGSGDREHPLKASAAYNVKNRLYVFRDDLNVKTPTAVNLDDSTSTSSVMCDFTVDTTCSPSGILPASAKKGWFITLPGTGEQTVTSAVIAAGMVTFSTNMPTPPSTTPKVMCTPELGVATGYWVNLFNGSGAIGVKGTSGGTRSAVFVGGGLPPSPVFATVLVGGKATTVIIGAVQRGGGVSSPIGSQRLNPVVPTDRKTIYWKSSGEN